MEHLEEVVLVWAKAKDSSTIVVSGGSASVQTVFTPALYLKNGRDYELGMVNLEKYYSFANIRADNNLLTRSADGGKSWTSLHIHTGCYELKAIHSEIIRMRGGNSDITIFPNVNTLQCILYVVGAKLKVSFDVPNSPASVLGFNRSAYGVGRQLVNIMSVNSILLLQHYSLFIHAWCTRSGCLQFLSKCRSWTEDTRNTKQFNLSPGNCRRHFNSVSVANGPTRKSAGSTWRGIDYTL